MKYIIAAVVIYVLGALHAGYVSISTGKPCHYMRWDHGMQTSYYAVVPFHMVLWPIFTPAAYSLKTQNCGFVCYSEGNLHMRDCDRARSKAEWEPKSGS